ncbi:lytic transglycosylase domain-containing protein, partial [Muricoccus pecuniae]
MGRRVTRFVLLASLACAAAALPRRGEAQAGGDWSACRQAIAEAEPSSGLPPGLLGAIALVESGARDPATGRASPWPWSYNAEGAGRAAPGRAEAIAEVSALLARGVRSVDVGCMQVNLLHHPRAFASLAEGFDPRANLAYAIRFLRELYARTGDWGEAVARYHSGEAERGQAYRRRVALAQVASGGASAAWPPVPDRVAAILRSAALAGLDREEARRLERHFAFQADLSSVRGLIARDPEAALRALADPQRYRGLSGEDRAALAGMAAREAEVARFRR